SNEEMQALKGLTVKKTEEENGIRYFKEISPIKFNEACLKCHEGKIDDVAAALSITFSLEESDKLIKDQQKVIAFIFILGIASIIFIIYYFINKFVITPISEISRASNLIATQGDLTNQIKKQSNDEIGQLSDHFNYMVDRLKNLVEEIKSAGLRIGSASAEFFASSEQQAGGATQQAAAVSEITATIEELSNTARQIAENSNAVVKISEETFHQAENGFSSVEDTIKGMEDIKNKAQQTSEKIVLLGERSQEIGEVIDIIDDIANQTKLLSLNAAIEAAKAGEYGKGFAVVAVEIRLLAENVVKSTTKIKNIVKEIQDASNASVMATEQSMKKIEDGVILAKKAGEGLKEILEIAEQTTSEAKQISNSIQQQKSANEQVVISMKEISDVTRQLAGGAKEGTAAVSELNKLAEELKIAINQFKTKS
ncbi:HAMP domain-containing protein, partial [Candidatus Desantisbacteria bacterium]|nr:HAMP domain-containing protein [Candidatus Desantisbacteria bacterium]